MPIRVGVLAEGNDHIILWAYLAKLLGVDEADVEVDFLVSPGRGWKFVMRNIDRALRRFYNQCAHFAVLSVDNDGDVNLQASGGQEDPKHPRHWLHDAADRPEGCRWCRLFKGAEAVRPALNWTTGKPGERWPILIAIPVETIEAWLVTTQAIVEPGTGSLYAEQTQRSALKQMFYGRPKLTREDVNNVALPLIRRLTLEGLDRLKTHSRSFADFAAQVALHAGEILNSPACWQEAHGPFSPS